MSDSVRPLASSMPTLRFRLSSPVHVSTRSPRPASPASVAGSPAHGRGETGDLRQSAGDQRGGRIVAEPKSLADAGPDRDGVLERGADLDADRIVVGIQAAASDRKIHVGSTPPERSHPRRSRRPSARRAPPRGRRSAPKARQYWLRIAPVTSRATSVMRSSVPCSMPLVALTNRIPGCEMRQHRAIERARESRRHHADDDIRALERVRPGHAIGSTFAGNWKPGRKTSFSRRAAMRSTRSASCAHSGSDQSAAPEQ